MTQDERDRLTHLAADWDARAADLERTRVLTDIAKIYRACAAQLRSRLTVSPPAAAGEPPPPGTGGAYPAF